VEDSFGNDNSFQGLLYLGEEMRRIAAMVRLILLITSVLTCVNNIKSVGSKPATSSSLGNSESGGFFLLESPSTNKALSGVAWKPDGSYALLIARDRHGYGSEIFKYDGYSYTLLLNDSNIIIQGTSWNPNGSYALFTAHYYANQNHRYKLFKYDGINFSTIQKGGIYDMRGISWKPDGSYALIVGGDFRPGRMMWKYDGINLTRIYDGDSSFSKFIKAEWKPDGSYALIIDFFAAIFKYNETSLSKLTSYSCLSVNSLGWSADGSYALITAWFNLEWEEHLVVLKFDGTQFTDITYQIGTANNLGGISSSSVSGTLIVGGNGTVLKYDGISFTLLTEGMYAGLGNVEWKPDGSQALIIGGGTVLLYVPDLFLKWNLADVNCDWKVNIYDAVLTCVAYTSTPSDPNWNPHCDIAEPYDIIDMFDIVMIAGSYGEEYNP